MKKDIPFDTKNVSVLTSAFIEMQGYDWIGWMVPIEMTDEGELIKHSPVSESSFYPAEGVNYVYFVRGWTIYDYEDYDEREETPESLAYDIEFWAEEMTDKAMETIEKRMGEDEA